jgi:hypothetical protein
MYKEIARFLLSIYRSYSNFTGLFEVDWIFGGMVMWAARGSKEK